MEKSKQIKALCLRYVIPFNYQLSFEEAVDLVRHQETTLQIRDKEDKTKRIEKRQRLWTEHRADMDTSESDLFDYIREEFLFGAASDPVPEKKGGLSWLHWQSGLLGGTGEKILNLQYFEKPLTAKDEQLPASVKLSVTNMGLTLFRNRFGMLWYEIELPVKKLNSDQLLLFQNRFKELNHTFSQGCFWEECKAEPDYGIVIGGKDAHKRYIAPILMGRWVRAQMAFLGDVNYFAQRRSAYASLVIQDMTAAGGLKNEKKELPEMEKDQLRQMLEAEPAFVPDKPLLFSYCLLADGEDGSSGREDIATFAFRFANGYMPAYLYSPEVAGQMRQPFENAFWYASQEGAAYCALVRPENEQTFNSTILQKVRTDYFTLYLKSLYQSFSLLIYARRIQKEIPAEIRDRRADAFTEPVTKLLGEISLFLTRSMATSVSHIHHQSDFYVYLKQRLRVKEDVESVTAGMNALEVLMREQAEEAEKQRDYRMQGILALFTLLGIFSALADCRGFFENLEMPHGPYLFFIVCIIIISLITIIYVRDVFIMIIKDLIKMIRLLVKKNPENGDK